MTSRPLVRCLCVLCHELHRCNAVRPARGANSAKATRVYSSSRPSRARCAQSETNASLPAGAVQSSQQSHWSYTTTHRHAHRTALYVYSTVTVDTSKDTSPRNKRKFIVQPGVGADGSRSQDPDRPRACAHPGTESRPRRLRSAPPNTVRLVGGNWRTRLNLSPFYLAFPCTHNLIVVCAGSPDGSVCYSEPRGSLCSTSCQPSAAE